MRERGVKNQRMQRWRSASKVQKVSSDFASGISMRAQSALLSASLVLLSLVVVFGCFGRLGVSVGFVGVPGVVSASSLVRSIVEVEFMKKFLNPWVRSLMDGKGLVSEVEADGWFF